MLSVIGQSITFEAFFVASKVGKTSLAVTVDVYNPAGTLVVTAGSATETGGGFYTYTLASGSVTTAGNYRAIFKTTDTTVDAKQIPSMWVVGRTWAEKINAGLDSSGRTRLQPDVMAAVMGYPAVRFVASGGNDSTGDGSLALPYATVTHAVLAPVAGMAVFVLSSITDSPTVPAGVTLLGPGWGVTITGDVVLAGGTGLGAGALVRNVRINGTTTVLTMGAQSRARDVYLTSAAGDAISASDHVTVDGVAFNVGGSATVGLGVVMRDCDGVGDNGGAACLIFGSSIGGDQANSSIFQYDFNLGAGMNGGTYGKAPAVAGAQMTLTAAERISVATAVEQQIMDETDGRQVLQAIVNKINATDTNLAGLSTAAIADAVWKYILANATGTSGGAAQVLKDLLDSIVTMLGDVKGPGFVAGTDDLHSNKTLLGTINAKTTNLPASPAATGAKMDLVDAPNATAVGVITAATNTALTAIKGASFAAGDDLHSIKAALAAAGGTTGSGADLCTQTITNSGTGLAIADADVWVSTDAAGTNIVAGTKQTNSIGKVTFLLDAGTPYYLWCQKDGVNAIKGQAFNAVAD